MMHWSKKYRHIPIKIYIMNIHKKINRLSRNGIRVSQGGFTLIEILVVLGILAILATLVLVAVNPSRQFKMARDTKRAANVATILNAVSQNIADHSGSFVCQGVTTSLPGARTPISSATSTGFDLAACIVPDYISALPYDPGIDTSYYTNEFDYNTNYDINQDAEGRVSITAISELAVSGEITATR